MVRDIAGRILKKGDHIILQNIQVVPLVIQEISAPIMRPGPNGQMMPIQTITAGVSIPITVVGDNGAMMGAYRVVDAAELPQEEKKIIQ